MMLENSEQGSASGKSFEEKIDNLSRGLREIGQSWDKRFRFDEIVLPENYIKGRFAFVFDFFDITDESEGIYISCECVVVHDDGVPACRDDACRDPSLLKGEQQHPVLIPITQFIKGADELVSAASNVSVSATFISKNAPNVRASFGLYRSLVDLTYQVMPIGFGEGHGSFLGSGLKLAPKAHPAIVQCRPKIIDDVSGKQEDFGGDLALRDDADFVGAGLWVIFMPDGVSVGCHDLVAPGLKLRDVMVGPFDLQ